MKRSFVSSAPDDLQEELNVLGPLPTGMCSLELESELSEGEMGAL